MWVTIERYALDAAQVIQWLGLIVAIYTIATTDLSGVKRGYERVRARWAKMRRRGRGLLMTACLVFGAAALGVLWNRLGIELPSLSPKMQIKLKILALAVAAATVIVIRMRVIPTAYACARRTALALPIAGTLAVGVNVAAPIPIDERRVAPAAYRTPAQTARNGLGPALA